jgi:hypothetical protein
LAPDLTYEDAYDRMIVVTDLAREDPQEAAIVKKSVSAWLLLCCYTLSLCTAAFHSHECRHEHDSGKTEARAAGPSDSAVPSFGGKLRLIQTVGSVGLTSHYGCCVGLRDCDQEQVFSTGSRVRCAASPQDQIQHVCGSSQCSPDQGFGPGPNGRLPLKPSPFFASLDSVRLLI